MRQIWTVQRKKERKKESKEMQFPKRLAASNVKKNVAMRLERGKIMTKNFQYNFEFWFFERPQKCFVLKTRKNTNLTFTYLLIMKRERDSLTRKGKRPKSCKKVTKF